MSLCSTLSVALCLAAYGDCDRALAGDACHKSVPVDANNSAPQAITAPMGTMNIITSGLGIVLQMAPIESPERRLTMRLGRDFLDNPLSLFLNSANMIMKQIAACG